MRDLHGDVDARELLGQRLSNYLKDTARAPSDETRKCFEILAELVREEIAEAGAQAGRRRARGVA